MYSTALLSTIACLVFSSQAATIPRQNSPDIIDAHVASFRSWGTLGCPGPIDNQGEYSFGVFDLNICFQFATDIAAQSVMVQNLAGGDQILCNGRLCGAIVQPMRGSSNADFISQSTHLLIGVALLARQCYRQYRHVTTTRYQALSTTDWAHSKRRALGLDLDINGHIGSSSLNSMSTPS